MNKHLVFSVVWCISSFVFVVVSTLITEGRPIARAAIGGMGILLTFLLLHFAPEYNAKKDTTYQKFIFCIDIIVSILAFLTFIMVIGMTQESLSELGYYNLSYVPDSP